MRKIDAAVSQLKDAIIEELATYCFNHTNDYDKEVIMKILDKYKAINPKEIIRIDCPFKYGLLDSETCANCEECWESEVEELND